MIRYKFGVAAMTASVLVGAGALWSALPLMAQGQQPNAASVALSLPAAPPQGAVVLFSGKENELKDLWMKRYTKEPAGWKAEKGVASPADKKDIVSKQEFGDCYMHVEFRCPETGVGNAGVALQGRYEVQIMNSYGKEPEKHGCGSLYSQKPPMVVASKKPGEWQSYDIFFRAPRFNEQGEVVEKPRVTVLQNGIVIQNNAEFTGMTGIQYSEFKEMSATGPVILQGDHDPVQYRNIWVVPM
ncbi:MAG: DUF1080 domain-containing protein [Armatimonadaceae bacterium]